VKCAVATYTSINTISRNHEYLHTYRGLQNMKTISNYMLGLLERLAEMFPNSSYQSRLDAYLSTKGITDAAQLENYIRQFNSQKENYL